MKKPAPPRSKKRKGNGLGYFTGGLAAAFLGGAIIKTRLEHAHLPFADSPPLSDTCSTAFDTASAPSNISALDAMIEKMETENLRELPLLKKMAQRYARDRGYIRSPDPKTKVSRAYHFEPNESHVILPKLSWDLRVLGYHQGSNTDTFTPNLAAALSSYQQYSDLPVSGQPDQATLEHLAHDAVSMRIQIGLHAKKAALDMNAPMEDILRLIDTESEGDPFAGAKTSSAKGLGQFLDRTWLELFNRKGEDLGYSHLQADAASILRVMRLKKPLSENLQKSLNTILGMRILPAIAVPMIVAYGIEVGGNSFNAADAYAGYMLGRDGAALLRKYPDMQAHLLLPASARANESVFYKTKVQKLDRKKRPMLDANRKPVMVWGNPRTGAEVLEELRNRVNRPDRVSEAANTARYVDDIFTQAPVKIRKSPCAVYAAVKPL